MSADCGCGHGDECQADDLPRTIGVISYSDAIAEDRYWAAKAARDADSAPPVVSGGTPKTRGEG